MAALEIRTDNPSLIGEAIFPASASGKRETCCECDLPPTSYSLIGAPYCKEHKPVSDVRRIKVYPADVFA
ncbi:MAG: hypothetical protein NT076_01000 [Candidatus Pacearchaeota archaeon]|nr:hypothetical protein [Candidatus Pacearchaeota archaeon]